jgi:ribosome maturation factor RimP
MLETSSHTPFAVDVARLRAVIEPICRAHGADLVAVELKNESGWILRVYVEKTGTEGADLELCAAISRDLSPALDVADLISHRYNLEVSSPGLERPLHGEADFRRFAGRKAKVKLRHESASKQKVFVGTIGWGDAGLTITEGTTTHAVPLADVEKARLVFEITKGKKSHRRGAPEQGK